jgi:hypothetical protein
MREIPANDRIARLADFYRALMEGPKKRGELAELLGVTKKTIDNMGKRHGEDLTFDRTLLRYRFKNLLPARLPADAAFGVLKKALPDSAIREDLATLIDPSLPRFVPTASFGAATKKLLALHVAIVSNCVIRFDYHGNLKGPETKTVRPHALFFDRGRRYLYASYDASHTEHAGEFRVFALEGIGEIWPVAYVKNGNFRMDIDGNAYGPFEGRQSVRLRLDPACAGHFRRDRLFELPAYELIEELPDGSAVMDFYYNEEDEAVRFILKWMPLVTLAEDSPRARRVAESVRAVLERGLERFGG